MSIYKDYSRVVKVEPTVATRKETLARPRREEPVVTRTHIELGTFSTDWLASAKNIADILTKALPRPLFSRHVSGLSLVSR